MCGLYNVMKKGYEVESQYTNEAKKEIFIHKNILNKNKNKQFDKQIEIKQYDGGLRTPHI